VKGQANQVSSATPKLAAEWLACIIIITATTLTKDGEYGTKMAEALWRMTAVTLLFFVLAIVSMSDSMNKITVAFGGLIVITILAKGTGEVKKVLDAAGGAGTGEDKTTLTADLNPNEPVPHNILQ
jgi:ABC-type multidrug transport system fused ATPase/permease subunit